MSQIDEYDPETGLTKDGKDFLRYLIGTEGGEVYMLAFHLLLLKELTSKKKLS